MTRRSLRDAKSERGLACRRRYQSGIQTGSGIVAPPNLRFGGGLKPGYSDATRKYSLAAGAIDDSLPLRYPPVIQNTQLNSDS